MKLLKTIFLVGLLFASLLLATSALAESPLISSHWEKDGWIITSKPEEAEITVTVTYSIPEVIHDRDTFYFKPFWSEVRKYADGTSDVGHCYTGRGIKTRCFGYSGISFDGMPEVQFEDEGIKVILDLSWSGRKTGHLKREFLVPWSELKKTVKDKEVEIRVSLGYPKKLNQKQLKPRVDYGNDIGENGLKEVAVKQELLRSLQGTNHIDKQQFNDLLKRYSELMITGTVSDDDRLGGEIGRQTDFFRRAYQLWYSHPELKDRTTTYQLKSMSDSIYTLIKVREIPNYIPKTVMGMSCAGEPPQGWENEVAKNNENNRENMIQRNIENSRRIMDGCKRNIDDVIANKRFGSKSLPRDERPLFFYSNGVFQKVGLPWSSVAQ